MAHANPEGKIFIEIDTTELSTAQVRLLKSLHHTLQHLLKTDNESEYFDSSAEAIRMCASLIKQARFIKGMKEEEIPYAEQVIEYSIDILQEHINAAKVVHYDN